MGSALHTCMLCEAVCGIRVETGPDGRVLSVRGDEDDPFSAGHICPKASGLIDLHDDPDRVREPLRRVGDSFQPVSWDEALSEAGRKLADIQRRHGRHSIAVYLGNPTVHSYSATLAVPLFGRALGTRSRFSATSVDQLPQMLSALEMFGHQALIPIPDVDRTSFFLVLGANPLVSNGSLMTAPGMAKRLKALKARGGKLVVIDPRRSETAAIADEHLFIRPGGDAFLILGMLHTLLEDGRLAAHATALNEWVPRFSPERVAKQAGIPAERIRALARAFASAPSAVCYGRVGICTQEYGGLAAWLVNVLNVVTGNFDRAGGSMFTRPAVDIVRIASLMGQRGHFARRKSRVRGLPEFGGELPVSVMAEEMETPGEGQIRALITYAGNPALSAPNGPRLERALSKLDYMVSIDLYRNETTRHANVILPTSVGLERDHYDLLLYAFAVRHSARYAKAVLKPPPGVRADWEVLLDLATAVNAHGGGRPDVSNRMLMRALRLLGPKRVLDLALRAGPYRLSVDKLARAPHGLDLGPLEPLKKKPNVVLAPRIFVDDLMRLERALNAPSVESDQLLLIGRRQLRGNNSWMHNTERLVKGPPACTLLMHPDDAHHRALRDGDTVRVRSRVGEVLVPLAVSNEMAVGVVSLPHGWGHARDGAVLQTAARRPGASINDLTDESFIDGLSATAGFSGVPVTVSSH